MKYFKERRRKVPKPKTPEAHENSRGSDKVGADTFTDQQVQANIIEEVSCFGQ